MKVSSNIEDTSKTKQYRISGSTATLQKSPPAEFAFFNNLKTYFVQQVQVPDLLRYEARPAKSDRKCTNELVAWQSW